MTNGLVVVPKYSLPRPIRRMTTIFVAWTVGVAVALVSPTPAGESRVVVVLVLLALIAGITTLWSP